MSLNNSIHSNDNNIMAEEDLLIEQNLKSGGENTIHNPDES